MLTTNAPVRSHAADTSRRRSPVLEIVSVVVVAAIIVVFLRQASRPLYDTDLWWHLRSGEEFWGSWSITDPQHLTPFATSSWFSPSWLVEMVFAKLEMWWGLPGVAWAYGLGLVVFTLVLYAVNRRHAGMLAAAVVTLLSAAAASGTLTPRPQVLSFVLLSATTGAWLATADDLRPRWWLVPMTWVWSMSHGMWLLGVATGGAVIVGLMMDGKLNRRSFAKVAAIPAACLAAGALTPQGPRNLLVFMEVSGWQGYITEYAPPQIPNFQYVVALLLVAIVVVTAMRSAGPSLSWAELAVLLQGVFWILYTVRSVPWGAVLVAPLAAAAFQSWLPRRDDDGMRRSEVAALGTITAVGLIVLALVVPHTATEPGRMPNGLNEQLSALPAGTPVFNHYGLGGWIEWQHRQLAPVIDGNTYQFEASAMSEHANAMRVEAGWRDYLTARSLEHALVKADSPVAHALKQRLGWQTLGTDAGFVLLRAPVQ